MKSSKSGGDRPRLSAVVVATEEQSFAEVVEMIRAARGRALTAVNTTLIDLYWQVGEFISRRIEMEGWGRGTVAELSTFVQKRHPGVRGFSPQNLWRMRQSFDAYVGQPELSTLLRELPWSSNLHILTRSKRPEEREFYPPYGHATALVGAGSCPPDRRCHVRTCSSESAKSLNGVERIASWRRIGLPRRVRRRVPGAAPRPSRGRSAQESPPQHESLPLQWLRCRLNRSGVE